MPAQRSTRGSGYWDDVVVSRLKILRIAPLAGGGLLASTLVISVVLGILPVVFVVATSVMIGRVPGAVVAGMGSPEWAGLTSAFAIAAGAFLGQQLLSPLQRRGGRPLRRPLPGPG